MVLPTAEPRFGDHPDTSVARRGLTSVRHHNRTHRETINPSAGYVLTVRSIAGAADATISQ